MLAAVTIVLGGVVVPTRVAAKGVLVGTNDVEVGKPAPPVKPARVLLLPSHWSGPVPGTHREALRSSFVEALAGERHQIVDDDGEPCASPPCRVERGLAARADLLVELVVTAADRDYEIGAILYDAATGESLADLAEPCRICGMVEVAALAGGHGLALREKIESLETMAAVTLETRPSGARVRIDGEMVGQTPLAVRLPAGVHEFAFELEGRVTVRRRVQLVARVREQIEAALPPVPRLPNAPGVGTMPPEPELRDAPRVGFIGGGSALVVASLAAAGGSAALFVLHGDIVDKRCDGLDIDFAGNCRYVRDTRSGGFALAVVAAAALAVGLGLVLAGARGGLGRRQSQRSVRAAR